MKKAHKELFRKNSFYIITHLNIDKHPQIIEFLLNKKCLTQDNVDLINNANNNYEKVYRLIDILKNKGPKGLEYFLDSLNYGDQGYIRDTLLLCLGEEDESKTYNDAVNELIDTTDSNTEVNKNDKRMIFIINNMEFINEQKRVGSDKDTEDIVDFFVNTLKYELYNDKPYIDLSAREMIDKTEEFANYLTCIERGLAVIVIMSHGKAGFILGKDEELVDIRKLIGCFSAEHESLYRTFIFSCCRGSRDALADTVPVAETMNKPYEVCSVSDLINEDRIRDIDRHIWKMAPPKSIVVYSTQINILSYRYDTGTIFIQALLSVFRKHFQKSTLREMLMKLKNEMGIMFPNFAQRPDVKENYFCDIKL